MWLCARPGSKEGVGGVLSGTKLACQKEGNTNSARPESVRKTTSLDDANLHSFRERERERAEAREWMSTKWVAAYIMWFVFLVFRVLRTKRR